MKNIGLWLILTIVSAIFLFGTVSLISNISFVSLRGEFEILLILIGFSTLFSSLVVCTKIIIDKTATPE